VAFLVYAGLTISGIIILLVFYLAWPIRRALPTESDISTARGPFWYLYYGHKYLRPVEQPGKGSNLALYFAEMRMFSVHSSIKSRKMKRVSLGLTGDLMYRRDCIGAGGEKLWELAGKDLFDADFCIGNLEFAVNDKNIIEKIVDYSAPSAGATPLLIAPGFGRFQAVSVANNHINDSGWDGIISTCRYLDENSFIHFGANRTRDEQNNFPIITVNGLRIALLGYSFTHNNHQLDQEHAYGLNLIRFNALHDRDYDPSLIHSHIELAKQRGAQYITASCHWGVEFECYPPDRLVRRARALMEAGIDCIIGHHPHILNPVELYTATDGRQCVCFYSLGSITTYALIRPFQHLAQIARLELEYSDEKTVYVRNVFMTPTYHLITKENGIRANRILPLLRTAEILKSGMRPEYISKRKAKIIFEIEKFYRRHFMQRCLIHR